MIDIAAAAKHYELMLQKLGIHGDDKTPIRYVRALAEFTKWEEPEEHLSVQFDEVGNEQQLIVVTDVPFVSLCEHHMLPFWGTATIGYLTRPCGNVVGLSKLPRALQALARRPQLQERLTRDMADELMRVLDAFGSAVTIRGIHTCMALRGVRTGTDAQMITTVRRGGLLEPSPHRQEFDALSLRTPWPC